MFTELVRIVCDLSWWVGEILNMVSPPENHPVLYVYVLSLSLPGLSYYKTVTVMSGNTCRPIIVKYLDITP